MDTEIFTEEFIEYVEKLYEPLPGVEDGFGKEYLVCFIIFKIIFYIYII